MNALKGPLEAEPRQSQGKRSRTLGKVGRIVSVVVIAALALNFVERFYLVNGDNYPRFLARDVGAADMNTIQVLRENQCQGDPIEVYEKADSWVLRCGMGWLDGHTFISSTDPFGQLKEGKQ